jgi:hypothetical protein
MHTSARFSILHERFFQAYVFQLVAAAEILPGYMIERVGILVSACFS